MSTIKSSDEHLTLNADGASKDIKFQANGVEVGSLSSSGVMTATTFTGAATDSTKLPLAGGTMTGDLLVTSTQPNIRLTDSDSSGYYAKVAQEGASTKIVADLGEVGSGRLRFYNGSGGDKLEITSDGRGLSQFTAKAWVNFNGTGTVSINDSHNVSSITDNGGVSSYTVNITNALANANYTVFFGGKANNGDEPIAAGVSGSKTSSAFTVRTRHMTFSANTNADAEELHALAFGD